MDITEIDFDIFDGSGQLRAQYTAATADDALDLYFGEAPNPFDDAYAVPSDNVAAADELAALTEDMGLY